MRIVGINVMDSVPTAKLLPFLKGKGLNITYAMAADGKGGPVHKQWLTPLGVDGIPFAMAVRDGKLIWRGHPNGLEEALIEAMAKPDYSPEKAPLTKEQRRRALLPKMREINGAAMRGETGLVKEGLSRLAAEVQDESLALPAFSEAFRSFLLRENSEGALGVLRLMVETYPKSRTALLNAGNMAIKTEELEKQDPDFAIACAESVLTGNPKDVSAMELKAAGLFAKGAKAEAVALQEEAVKSTKLRARIEALRAEIAAGK